MNSQITPRYWWIDYSEIVQLIRDSMIVTGVTITVTVTKPKEAQDA